MFQAPPPVTQVLIALNVIAYLLQGLIGGAWLDDLMLWPPGPQFAPWQVLTYAFLHGSLTHLLFNMLGLYMFGSDIERVWGEKRYLVYYITCVISAAIAQLLVTWMMGSVHPTVGASGGVFGLLLAFGMAFPQRRILLLFPPIPMPAWLFVTLYGLLELTLGVTGTEDGVAHFAHLGGMAAGFALLTNWGWRIRRR